MAAVLDATEDRLGEDGAALRDASTQLQMVFVQVSAEVKAAAAAAADTEARTKAPRGPATTTATLPSTSRHALGQRPHRQEAAALVDHHDEGVTPVVEVEVDGAAHLEVR